jgi:predicted ATPase
LQCIVATAIEVDPSSQSILVIGTYRSNEIDETHFLPTAIDLIRKHDIPHHDIRLSPLSRQAISDMIKDTVRMSTIVDDIDMEALSECVYSKTDGNAFFATHVNSSISSAE